MLRRPKLPTGLAKLAGNRAPLASRRLDSIPSQELNRIAGGILRLLQQGERISAQRNHRKWILCESNLHPRCRHGQVNADAIAPTVIERDIVDSAPRVGIDLHVHCDDGHDVIRHRRNRHGRGPIQYQGRSRLRRIPEK